MGDNTSDALVVHNQEDDSKNNNKVVLDALPYFDTISEDYERYAQSLIEEEMKKIKPPSYAKPLPSLKLSTPLLKNSYEKLSSSQQENNNNNNKVLPIEFDKGRATEPSQDTIEAWREAVRDARAEYEAERQRSIILEIEKSEASTKQWKLHGGLLDTLKKNMERHVEVGRNTVDRINAIREQQQYKAGKTINILNTKYYELKDKNFQLKMALRNLEIERDSLKEQVSNLPATNDTNDAENNNVMQEQQ